MTVTKISSTKWEVDFGNRVVTVEDLGEGSRYDVTLQSGSAASMWTAQQAIHAVRAFEARAAKAPPQAGQSGDRTFADLWEWIRHAREADFILRKRGIPMSEVTPDGLLHHITEDLGKLAQSHRHDKDTREDIGDLMALLMHYAMMDGFTEAQVVNAAMDKLQRLITPRKDGEEATEGA